MRSEQATSAHDRIAAMKSDGIEYVHLLYPDLHGVARGKVIPLSVFHEIAEHGIPFVSAIMTVDLRHNIVAGFETGFEDILARPDLETIVHLPWEPKAAWCLADLECLHSGEPYGVSPRATLRRAIEAYTDRGLIPVCGPELEFYLCEPHASAHCGYRRYGQHDSPVYTVGFVADRLGVLNRMLESCVALGLGAFAANQEYGRGQFEINIGHAPALASADRAFMFKALVKELAARDGLLATFMGKPWNDDEGSGFHLHLSLANMSSPNAFDDPGGPDGLSKLVRPFTAGVLAHAPALMAFLNPTVNAYRRIAAQGLVPTRINWGHDNRFTLVRVPRERGKATRIEVRVGDGTANPYLAYAAVLIAGLDGITRDLEPPAPLSGNIYALPEEEQGDLLPASLEAALDALGKDSLIAEGMGEEMVSTYTMMKNAELSRYQKWVSDWEFTEYSHHL